MSRLRVVWRTKALADLQALYDWLASIEGAKPKQVILRVRAAANALERLGDIGRPSIVEGLRELSVRNAPYVIVYRVSGASIDIVAVFHTAQQR